MRVAIFSESPSDEAALRVLVGKALNTSLEPIKLSLRSRGWPAVRQELRAVLRDIWLNQRADALVVSVDTDHSPIHETGHDTEKTPDCRQCVLQKQLVETTRELRERNDLKSLLNAVASASPAVEAWLLYGKANAPTETSWRAFLMTDPTRFEVKMRVNELKRLVYGSPKPGEARAISVAREEAGRIARDLPSLAADFPGGFGTLYGTVGGWTQPPKS
jgi:hypothetical protein